MLETLVVLCATVAVLGLLGLLLGVLPFVLTVDRAERLGFSPDRWGAVAIGGIVLMLGLGYWVLTGGHSLVLLLPALAFAWVGLGVLSIVSSGVAMGGRQGLHER